MMEKLAQKVVDHLKKEGRFLVIAESCTGGMISEAITSVPGASDVFVEGLVTYSNRSKQTRLGVDPEAIQEHGAVSEEVALEMAEGAFLVPNITDAVSVTGIAGPTGGTEEKPVGSVWFGLKQVNEPYLTAHRKFEGSRTEVRKKSTVFVLNSLLDRSHMEQSKDT